MHLFFIIIPLNMGFGLVSQLTLLRWQAFLGDNRNGS